MAELCMAEADQERGMMGYLTFNRNLPFRVLRVLTEDKWLWARNYSTPQGILVELARDDDWQVRHSVARNPSTPAHILEKLSKDRSSDVRFWVAKNPSTPGPVRKLLAEDQNPQVRVVASLIICRQAG